MAEAEVVHVVSVENLGHGFGVGQPSASAIEVVDAYGASKRRTLKVWHDGRAIWRLVIPVLVAPASTLNLSAYFAPGEIALLFSARWGRANASLAYTRIDDYNSATNRGTLTGVLPAGAAHWVIEYIPA